MYLPKKRELFLDDPRLVLGKGERWTAVVWFLSIQPYFGSFEKGLAPRVLEGRICHLSEVGRTSRVLLYSLPPLMREVT